MKTIRTHHVLLFGLLATGLLFTSCKKEEDAHVPPSMSFKTGATYTSANDTVGLQDTLLIGVTVDKTEDELTSLNVSRGYDGGGTSTIFNESISGDHYEHDQQVITRNQAGTELYTFTVVDRDGNVTTKSITLVVQ